MITFFKQKKDKQVYEHKADAKISKLGNFIVIFNSILNKIHARLSFCFRKIRKNCPRRL